MRAALILAVAASLLPAAAPAAVRALFVGIDHYDHAVPAAEGDIESLQDLHGATADALMVRDAFVARYGIAPGAPDPGCAAAGATIVLLDRCATRARILAALIGQIGRAASGDTVLFYYAGHGSLAQETLTSQQAGRANSTIVPVDGRGGDVADILDVELRAIIDAAEGRGVSVVTIFDSCHSGSATRDLRPAVSRAAPASAAPAAPATLDLGRLPPPDPGDWKPYRVHLAAAADAEIAKEVRVCFDAAACPGGPWHGVFSRALADALAQLPAPTYADLIAAVRRTMAKDDQSPAAVPLGEASGQHSQAEGSLATPVLGVRAAPARRFAAEPGDPGTVRIAGGRIAGVTPGSTYGLYASVADARPDGPAVAKGLVGAVEAGRAVVAVGGPLSPGPLTALELTHAYGAEALRLRIDAEPGLAARLAKLIGKLGDAVTVSGDDPGYVLRAEPGGVRLATIGGAPIGSVLDPAAKDFGETLADSIRKVAQAHALLALAGDAGARMAKVRVRADCDDDAACGPLPVAGDETLIPAGTRFVISVENVDPARKLYAYAFYVDADHGILPLLTPEGAVDPPLGHRKVREVKPLVARGAGRDQVVVIMSERPVDLAALAQDRVRDMGPPPAAGLARLLRFARDGRAARDIVDSGDWGATLLPLRRVAATGEGGK